MCVCTLCLQTLLITNVGTSETLTLAMSLFALNEPFLSVKGQMQAIVGLQHCHTLAFRLPSTNHPAIHLIVSAAF